MKKKGKSKLILILACLAATFFMGGCAISDSLDEVLEKRNVIAQVTYYSNGGTFDGNPDVKEMYFAKDKDGNLPKALNIGVVNPYNGEATITRNDYDFVGWYHAVLDADGNPEYEDEAKTILKLGDPVDFSVALQEDEHWHLVACWTVKVRVQVQLVVMDADGNVDKEATIAKKVKDGQEAVSYKYGDTVETRAYDTSNKVVEPSDGKVPFEVKGSEYTFTQYFEDEACTKPVAWPIEKKADQTEDVAIYAKYIKGNWSVIRKARDISTMFSSLGDSKKFYFIKDIDASELTVSPNPGANCNGEIRGNGYTIAGLKVLRGALSANDKISLFGNILAAAKIENLKFTDLNVEYTFRTSPAEAYFAFTSIQTGATVSNITMAGKMKVLQPSGGTVKKALYGGYASDEEYLTVSGRTGFVAEATIE